MLQQIDFEDLTKDDFDDFMSDVEFEIEDLESEVGNLQGTVHDLEAEIRQRDETIDGYEREFRRKIEKNQELEHELQLANSMIDGLREALRFERERSECSGR